METSQFDQKVIEFIEKMFLRSLQVVFWRWRQAEMRKLGYGNAFAGEVVTKQTMNSCERWLHRRRLSSFPVILGNMTGDNHNRYVPKYCKVSPIKNITKNINPNNINLPSCTQMLPGRLIVSILEPVLLVFF